MNGNITSDLFQISEVWVFLADQMKFEKSK